MKTVTPLPRNHAEITDRIKAAGRRMLEDVVRRAEFHGTTLATMKNGKFAQVTPDEFRRMMNLPR